MSRVFVIFFLILGVASSAFAQKVITLDEAVSIALQQNSGLLKSTERLKSSETNVKSKYGDFLPDLDVSGSFNWQRNEGIQSYDANIGQFISADQDSRSWSVRAGGGVMLFNGLANYANLESAKNTLDAGKFNLIKLKQDIVYSTTGLYYNILAAEELLKVRNENVKYNQKLLETIEERNRLGSLPIADVYAQQVQLGNAQLQAINAENALDAAKNTLLDYLALDVFEDYIFSDPFGDDDTIDMDSVLEEFDNYKSMVSEAMKNRYDYKAGKKSLESTMNNLTISRSGFYPTLSGSYSFSTGAATPGDLFDARTYSAGLTLRIPIFSNWNTEYSVQIGKVSVFEAEEDLKALERSISIEIKQGHLDLVAAKKALEVSSKNVISAGENRKINNEKYSLGSGTILDVLQAVKDYQEALRNKIDAKYDYYNKLDNLMNALGKLDYNKFEN
ncbi:MAG: outer membrane channel protein TolC [Melioribacteraceae bacterium]|nr:MAG: outer membrane channel protein TolC [Melioribacteraceae bacterium]